jgi:hypothetical protein
MTPAEAAEILKRHNEWRRGAAWLHQTDPATLSAALDVAIAALSDNVRMRSAIERALADEESGTGWGPDVTVCGYLREAIT